MLLRRESAHRATYNHHRLRGLRGYVDSLPPFNASNPTAYYLALANAILTDPQAQADYAAQGGTAYANAIIANKGYLPSGNLTLPKPPVTNTTSTTPPTNTANVAPATNTTPTPAPAPAPPSTPVVTTVIPLGMAGNQVVYSDGSVTIIPFGMPVPSPGDPKGASSSPVAFLGPPTPAAVPPSPAPTQGTENMQVDANGNLTWAFAPQDAPPFQLYYDNGDQNWQPLATGQSGSVSLASLIPGPHTIVMHAGGNEVDRISYTVPAIGGGPGTVGIPSWFTDPTQELISGIPNWATSGGALILAWTLFKKK